MRRLDGWITAAVVVGLALRCVRLAAAPLWFDETFTAQWASLPWSEMLRVVVADNHPPLYFVLVKGWAAIAGPSPWALRLPSVLLSTAVVPLVAATAGVLAGGRAARWAAWLAAISPMLVHHAQEARMYPLVAVLAACHLLMLARFLTGRTRGLGVGFVLVAAALLASHYYTLFLVGGEILALLILRPVPVRAWLPAAAAASVVSVAAFLVAALLARHQAGGEYAIGAAAYPGIVWAMLAGYELLPSSEALHAEGLRAAARYLPLALAVAPAFVWSLLVAMRTLEAPARTLLLATLGAALAGPFAVRIVLGVGVNPRYFIAALPALLVLLAAAAPRVAAERARVAATAVLGTAMLLALTLHLADPAHGREDVRAAGAWLDAHVPPEAEIVVTSSEMEYLAAFHWPGRRFRLYPAYGMVARADNADALAAAVPFADDRAIYLIGRAWTSDPSGALQAALSRRFGACGGTAVRGIEIRCLSRADGRQASQ